MSRDSESTSSPSRKFGRHSSQVAEIQIDQAEWISPTGSLKHKFSVIIDECCQLKVAKMLFPMKDTHLHQNPVWTELRDFFLMGVLFWKTTENTGRQ